jgi:hypothetical protein
MGWDTWSAPLISAAAKKPGTGRLMPPRGSKGSRGGRRETSKAAAGRGGWPDGGGRAALLAAGPARRGAGARVGREGAGDQLEARPGMVVGGGGGGVGFGFGVV